MGQGLRKKKEEIIIVISFIYLFNLCNEGGGERGREKEKKEGLRELRTQPFTSCKAANRLCRSFMFLYKYLEFTLAFGACNCVTFSRDPWILVAACRNFLFWDFSWVELGP